MISGKTDGQTIEQTNAEPSEAELLIAWANETKHPGCDCKACKMRPRVAACIESLVIELRSIDEALGRATKCIAPTRARRISDSIEHTQLVADVVVFESEKAEQSVRRQCTYWMEQCRAVAKDRTALQMLLTDVATLDARRKAHTARGYVTHAEHAEAMRTFGAEQERIVAAIKEVAALFDEPTKNGE